SKAVCAIKLKNFVAGMDVFSRQSNGFTIADQYEDLGIDLSHAFTGRTHGWAEIQRRLGDPAAGRQPTLFIHNRCARLIDTLPNLLSDSNDPEDVLKTDPDE